MENYKNAKCKECRYRAICSSLTNNETRRDCLDFIRGDIPTYFDILDFPDRELLLHKQIISKKG